MPDEELHKVIPDSFSPTQSASEGRVKIYPTFELDDEDLPSIRDWKVGERHLLVIEVEQMSMKQGKDWQGDKKKDEKKINATFKVLKVGVRREDYGEEYARRRSNAPH